MKLTRQQKEALLKVYKRSHSGCESFIAFRRKVVKGPDCIMVPWCGMWLGIEDDGYTHS